MKYAVIGYGKMGKLYDNLLKCSYIVDQFPVNNRLFFASVEEFIYYKPCLDLVIVCTTSNTHYSITKSLLLCGYNVLVEKPICLSSSEAEELEKIANRKHLVLYQSTLERYNPLIKYFKRNLKENEIEWIESYRTGAHPNRFYVEDAKFDLGIHDVDLFFYLVKNKDVKWIAHVEYGNPCREIKVHLKNKGIIIFDLLNKKIHTANRTLDLASCVGNPILEMVEDIGYHGFKINEKWSSEISLIEKSRDNIINLGFT